MIKSCGLGLIANYRGYLAAWIVAGDGSLIACKFSLQQAGFPGWPLKTVGWFPGRRVKGRGSEFYFDRWSGHRLFVCSLLLSS